MKQLKNTKGMSLVEVVMAILIISIASVLLVQSLSTVTTVISKADRRSYVTNEQLTTLVGSQVSDQVTVVEEEKEVTITADGLSEPIKIQGTYQEASSDDGTEVALRNFTVTEKREDIYQKMLADAKAIYDETLNMSAAQKQAYLAQLEAKSGVVTGITCRTGVNNDDLRAFYYAKHSFSKVNQEVIDECNKIFDQTHPSAPPNSHEAKAKLGSRSLYWKPYHIDNQKGNFILSAVLTNTLDKDMWRTYIVYNEKDNSLYYKLFPSNGTEAASYAGLTSYTSLAQLQNELMDTTKWRKLKIK